jgi:YVTN family beta-propeller protein
MNSRWSLVYRLRARAALRATAKRTAPLILFACSLVAPDAAQVKSSTPKAQSPVAAQATAAQTPIRSQKIAREDVTVEFSIAPTDKAKGLEEGAEAVITFQIMDAANRPLVGAQPAAWLSRKESAAATDAKTCREKIVSFMQGSVSARPEVDLNSYFILALNDEPSITVIDPLISFGRSKLLAAVPLKSPGEDWVLSADGKRVFVSMPLADQVAVVDTTTWKVIALADAGEKPARLRLQPDGKYLWIADDGEAGGVTVIDATTFKVAARVATGAGRHEIAFGADSRLAFVTNRRDGTLSVVDVSRLAKLADLKTGASPVALAFSPTSKSIYVADEADGTISVVDPTRRQIVARIASKPGVRALRFEPGGRYGFVVNSRTSSVEIIDATTNRVLHSIEVGKSPDQIGFTKEFAYVRSSGSEMINLIRLSTIGKELEITKFPGGQLAPEKATGASSAQSFAPAPEGNAMFVANAADRMIYYYQEGMAAPMGSFQNYMREPRGVMIYDRSLHEIAPGVYRTTATLPAAGAYDVAFLLDQPRLVNCFELSVAENPAIKKADEVAIRVEPLTKEQTIKTGESYQFRFRVLDAKTGQPKPGVTDLRVLVFLAPGIWQQRLLAQPLGEGVYAINFTPPQDGVYYIFFSSPSLGVEFKQLPHVMLQAVKP